MNLMNKKIKFIEQWLKTNTVSEDTKEQIDFVERALELLRIKHRHLENKITFESFLQGQISIDEGKLSYIPCPNLKDLGSGTRPIHLQPKLLIYLLLNYKKKLDVYNIIEAFIDEIWGELKIVDLKKTKTGVTRCFTNTRFAANTLRDYGLLKFSKKEAYKTWTLSLMGFLVGSKLLQKNLHWQFSEVERTPNQALHPEILSSSLHFKTYPDFVKGLETLCNPNKTSEIFNKFDSVLRQAHKLLDEYWAIIDDTGLSQKKRQEESKAKIEELEAFQGMDEFYKEFSVCIYVDNFLEKLMEQDK